MDPRCVSGN